MADCFILDDDAEDFVDVVAVDPLGVEDVVVDVMIDRQWVFRGMWTGPENIFRLFPIWPIFQTGFADWFADWFYRGLYRGQKS